jgi:hypothetical protein
MIVNKVRAVVGRWAGGERGRYVTNQRLAQISALTTEFRRSTVGR